MSVICTTDDDEPELMATAQSMLAAYVDVDVNDTLVNDDTEMVAGPGHDELIKYSGAVDVIVSTEAMKPDDVPE